MRATVTDALIAAVFTVASLYALRGLDLGFGNWAAVVTTVPLAARRRYPLATFLVIVIAALLTKNHATDITFMAIVFAGYSAAVHSRYRGAALLSLTPVGLIIAVVFWSAQSLGRAGLEKVTLRNSTLVVPEPVRGSSFADLPGLDSVAEGGPLRVAGLLIMVSLVSVAVVGAVIYAGDRIRRLQAEHEEATRRAVERERARIASELHDVVTHNVSVMIVQAGAARQVLADSPGKARTALLAVEASGRAAMTELRHLLGLLNPALTSGAATPGTAVAGTVAGRTVAGRTVAGRTVAGRRAADSAQTGPASLAADEDLRPQPGLDQVGPLIDRVTAAGLPVELHIGGERRELPPGLDLAAFRVVQEALTNVLKHAGSSPTSIRLDYRDTYLMVDVADGGRPPLGSAPPVAVPAGAGRGLLGLRERVALYGGEMDAGPRPGGGWRVRVRFPLDPPSGMYRIRRAAAAAVTPTTAEPQ
jgi:signal transduction histidine kinase